MADEDPYLWLEEIDGEAALEWVRSRNDETTDRLTADPQFEALQSHALAILTSDARIPYGALRGGYVYNFWQDDVHVKGIWRRATLESYRSAEPEWQVLLDIDALAEAEGENWSFKGASCLAPDYDRCLISLSPGGGDASEVREYSIAAEGFVEGGFFVPTAKSGVDWADNDTLYVGTDWGEGSLTESGYPRVLKRWRRGTPLETAETFFEGEVEDVAVGVSVFRRPEGATTVVHRAVTFYDSEYYLMDDAGALAKMPLPAKSELMGVFEGKILATLQQDWSYRGAEYKKGALVALQIDGFDADAVYAPGPREAIAGVNAAKSAIYVELLDNVVGKLKRFTPSEDGWTNSPVSLPDNGTLSITTANAFRDDFMVNFENPVTPDSLFYFANGGTGGEIIKSTPDFYDANDVVVEQRIATSADGENIPYFVMGRKNVIAQGNAPTVLYGYGGFLIPILPQYQALAGKLWMERGGVYVLANIRGGGEFGPEWHAAALKHNRQRAYDDFHAVAEALKSTGVANRVGIIGGSNGGLLVGAAFTQRPDLYDAVLCAVPLLDMLRYHKLLAGASWVGEYGDPDNPEDREVILTYSPYQNVKADADYPEVFFLTSTRDDRVHPGHARKMAAKMLEQGHKLFYYEQIDGGHGAATNQKDRAFQQALQYVYFSRQLMD